MGHEVILVVGLLGWLAADVYLRDKSRVRPRVLRLRYGAGLLFASAMGAALWSQGLFAQVVAATLLVGVVSQRVSVGPGEACSRLSLPVQALALGFLAGAAVVGPQWPEPLRFPWGLWAIYFLGVSYRDVFSWAWTQGVLALGLTLRRALARIFGRLRYP